MDYEHENLVNDELSQPEKEREDPKPDLPSFFQTAPLDMNHMDVPSAETVQPIRFTEEEAPSSDETIYHGAGVGHRETTFHIPADFSETMEQDPEHESENEVRKPKFGLKAIKVAIASVLVFTLVFVGCSTAVVLCNRHWQREYDLLKQNMNEKVSVLQNQLENIKIPSDGSGSLADPGETLSAAEIYRQNINSVVAITCQVGSGSNASQSSGSGFIISADGYVATNHHVINNANKITVTMSDGTSYNAVLVGSNDTNDIALVKIGAKNLKPVTIGRSSDLMVGDQVVAIGNALGELSFSLSVGYVSGMDRDVSTDGTVINMIQTDAAINSGNSGGPLFNARGEVVGITTAKYSGTTSSGATIEGISFAIPMDDVIDMFEDLQEFGYIRSAYLGVMVWEVDANVAETYNLPLGVYVEDVTFGYCAEKAGVRPKDIIIEIGGYKVHTMNDLSRALRNLEAGETVTIVVWRSGIEVIMDITLDEKPAS